MPENVAKAASSHDQSWRVCLSELRMNIPDFNEGRVGETALVAGLHTLVAGLHTLVAGLLCQHEINIRGRDLFPDSTSILTSSQMTLLAGS